MYKRSRSIKTVKPAARAIIVFVCIVALLIPAIAQAGVCYWGTVSFGYPYKAATRWYNGNNVNISLYSTASWNHVLNKNFSVELWRYHWWGSDYIGATTVPRYGSGSGRWTSVGSGNYFFYYVKANDGVWITSNVTMWAD